MRLLFLLDCGTRHDARLSLDVSQVVPVGKGFVVSVVPKSVDRYTLMYRTNVVLISAAASTSCMFKSCLHDQRECINSRVPSDFRLVCFPTRSPCSVRAARKLEAADDGDESN